MNHLNENAVTAVASLTLIANGPSMQQIHCEAEDYGE